MGLTLMTLNSMPDAGSVRSSGTLGRRLRSNASHLALAAGLAVGLGHSAEAATYTAANETELAQAITDAQASPDASSTITLTGSFSLSGALPAISSKAITIESATAGAAG